MQLQRILFPTDFSESGGEALLYATALARDTGAKLIVLHVEEQPLAYGAGHGYYSGPEPEEEDLLARMQALQPHDDALEYEYHIITGDPGSRIAGFAKEQEVDLIVMGTHGRSGLLHLLLGSVAEAVVRHAHCPVMTYKQASAN